MDILTVAIVFLLLYLLTIAGAVLTIGPLVILQPQRRRLDWYNRITSILEPRQMGLPQENFEFLTREGFRLRGWIISQSQAGKQPEGTIIFHHGIGDNRLAGLPLADVLFKAGFSVVLYDCRHHGESEGNFCTYGFYEKYDVTRLVNYLAWRRDLQSGEIGFFGTSMGAAVGIQTAAIDPRIRALVAEASFTDLRTISVDYQKRLTKLPWKFLRNVAMSRTQLYANFKARYVSPLKDLIKVRIPILFIHGTDDGHVRPEYSRILFDQANQPKELMLVQGADHINIMEVGGRVYEERIINFFKRNLNIAVR